MKGLITICARGGSKGVPKKKIKKVDGIPLIAYSIRVARKFQKQFDCNIELSTDSREIKQVASFYGLETSYNRPDYLATDEVTKGNAIKDLVVYSEQQTGIHYDYVLDLDVSSPLRALKDLVDAFEIFNQNKECLNLFSVNEASKNPYFNMVEKTPENYYALSKKIGLIKNRQTAPKVWELNASFYFYKRAYFDKEKLEVINDRSLIHEMSHICFDIDEPVDFLFFSIFSRKQETKF
ncbi:MAG: acylneuraminate cytidylyltransferase family protein [Flavobacteriales bacterium]|nr:acylneuraminate cytidylyltransferase family protein [Flavobacteriales bacterium]